MVGLSSSAAVRKPVAMHRTVGSSFIIIINVQCHENAIRKRSCTHYRLEAVLNGFQLSKSSIYLDYEHHPIHP